MSHPQNRRPRFERAPIRPIMLTPRDHEILRAVHRHRLLRSTHLVALTGGSKQTTLRRLQLLFHHGYLDRPSMQLDWYAQGSEPLVYALGHRGAELLEAEGVARPRGIRWETKKRNVSRVFLHHTLAVAEVMVAFEIACWRREGVRFIPPEEVLAGAPPETRRLRLPFRWQVEVRRGGKPYRLGVEPDRIFGLEFDGMPENRRRAYFFLEADRGTMPVTRKGLGQTSIIRKFLAYQETWKQSLHKTHLDIPNFRVLVVTTSTERVKRFVAEGHLHLGSGSRLFLFADQERLRRGNVLTEEWVDGRGGNSRLLAGVHLE